MKDWLPLKLAICCGLASAANAAPAPPASPEVQAPGQANPNPAVKSVATEHSAFIGGRRIRYTAIAGETLLNGSAGTTAASIYSFSYLAHERGAVRPVVFVFNGGPGSSSVWTHLGMIGPRKVALPDPVHPPTSAPFKVVDSPHSLLAVADLVFIDPVGTGYSRLLPGARAEDFLGVTQDARATADFIQAWLGEHGRWNAPKFLLGESYGTARAIMTSQALMGGVMDSGGQLRGISLNGLIILGPAFEIGPPVVQGDDREFLNNLPTMAAAAWVHHRLSGELTLDQAVEAARKFAQSDYLAALYAGNRVSAEEQQRLASRLAELTAVPREAWLAANLRIGLREFSELLLKVQGQRIGAYDARYTLPLTAEGNDPVADDAAMGQYTPAFVGALHDYVRNELKLQVDRPYVAIDWKNVFFKWDRGAGPGAITPKNYATDLAVSMRRNPALRLFVGVGYYDLVTTYGAAEYALTHAAIAAERTTLRGYASGHMPYLGEETSHDLSEDIQSFIVRRPKQ